MIYRLHKLLAPYNNTRGTVNLTCCSILDPWPMKFFSLTVVSNGIFFFKLFHNRSKSVAGDSLTYMAMACFLTLHKVNLQDHIWQSRVLSVFQDRVLHSAYKRFGGTKQMHVLVCIALLTVHKNAVPRVWSDSLSNLAKSGNHYDWRRRAAIVVINLHFGCHCNAFHCNNLQREITATFNMFKVVNVRRNDLHVSSLLFARAAAPWVSLGTMGIRSCCRTFGSDLAW